MPTLPTNPAAGDAPPVGVLVSGGLDSSILLAHLLRQGRRVQPFYVRFHLVWEEAEERVLHRFLDRLAQPRLAPLVTFELPLDDVYLHHWSRTGQAIPDQDSPDEAVYLPGRNALLLIKAVLYCQLHGIPQLALAPLGTSPFADASQRFFDDFLAALNRGCPQAVSILLPFARYTKQQVMQLGRELPLELTFSCLAPIGDQHCGHCNKCAERRAAFALLGQPDPTTYAAAAMG